MSRLRPLPFALVLLLAAALGAVELPPAASTPPVLRPGDRVAIIGDSITEQKSYSRMIEVYLLASSGVTDLDVAQFGWSGERAAGWVQRGGQAVAWFKPTVATTCYGMNDGSYRSFTDEIGKTYRDNLGKAADQLMAGGVRALVLASPGAVDTTTWRNPIGAAVYNQNLERLAGIAQEVAAAKGARFADIHHPMVAAMAEAKAALGGAYHVAGTDGVHPDQNGHLIMAGAILAALGCDGAIARIELAADGTAQASPGHAVLSAQAGAVELESRRWPFVLGGDGKSPASTRSIAPYFGFIERLDRFVVAMPSCPWPRARITWGERSAEVDGAALRAGVNLMAVFTATPFDAASEALNKAVAGKQDQETMLVKGLIGVHRRRFLDEDAESRALLQQLIDRQAVVRNERAAALRALVAPVRHRIAVAEAK